MKVNQERDAKIIRDMERGKRQKDIAKELGISVSRVQQIGAYYRRMCDPDDYGKVQFQRRRVDELEKKLAEAKRRRAHYDTGCVECLMGAKCAPFDAGM